MTSKKYRVAAGTVIAALMSGASTGSASAADQLCSKLADFERAPLAIDANGKHKRRSVEFRWNPPQGDEMWSKSCVRDDDAPNRQFCHWLVQNLDWEFPHLSVWRVLECRGYRGSQPLPQWSYWKARIDLPSKLEDRQMYLDVNLERGGMRISVVPFDEDTPPGAIEDVPKLLDELGTEKTTTASRLPHR